MKRVLVLSLTLVFVAAGLTARYSSAAEWFIPHDYGTVQSAIDSAGDGDVIIIQPGTYVENINFLGKAVTVKSTNPDDPQVVAATIIDGGKAGRVVTFENGEGNTSLLIGVTVRNGEVAPPIEGGGIFCESSSPSIIKCTITENSASGQGGGICCKKSSSPSITDCIIVKNSALSGGGIYCLESSPDITGCIITENVAAEKGGGVYCDYYSSLFMVNTILWGNGSEEICAGYESYPKLSYCDIQGAYRGVGNIDADPLFVDPENGDYRLQDTSPCKDAGHPRMIDLDSSISDIGGGGGEQTCAPVDIKVAVDGSGDFASIQEAIDSAFAGDIITVLPGTYMENLVIGGKDVSLIGQYGADYTVIDGSRSGPVVTLINLKSNSRLEGFTIQNGLAVRSGGGINCLDSSPLISGCIITRNSAAEYGGGINCDQKSSPSVTQCSLTGNSALSGGGIYCAFSSPTITDCLITRNSATGSDNSTGGGGIYGYNSAPRIVNCTVTSNSASFGGGIGLFGPLCHRPEISYCRVSRNSASSQGGGIYIQCDALSIGNSSITENSADYGGGIYCTWPITGFVTDWSMANCIIARNSARLGAGINCSGYTPLPLLDLPEYHLPSPGVTNCTITENSASLYGGGILSILSSPIVINCILWENSPNEVSADKFYRITGRNFLRGYRDPGTINKIPAGVPRITYSNVQGGYTGEGNINQHPLFLDPGGGDYHLQYNSPCIDTGTDRNISDAGEEDTEPLDGDGDGVADRDMGAYEYGGPVPQCVWVSMDVYPEKDLNTVDLISRKVYIVILGDEGFDVTKIDPGTILLVREGLRGETSPVRWIYEDVASASESDPDYSRVDGYTDLILTFNNQKFIRTLNLREAGTNEAETISLTLTGNLEDGSDIRGRDDVYKPARRQSRVFLPLWPR